MTVEAAKKLRVGDRVRWDGPDLAEQEEGTVHDADCAGVTVRWDGGGSGTFRFDESSLNINHINIIRAIRPPEASPSVKPFRDMTEPEIEALMTDTARAVESRLPPGPSEQGKALFVLVVFGEDQIGQASNAGRADVIAAIREFADVLESREDVPR